MALKNRALLGRFAGELQRELSPTAWAAALAKAGRMTRVRDVPPVADILSDAISLGRLWEEADDIGADVTVEGWMRGDHGRRLRWARTTGGDDYDEAAAAAAAAAAEGDSAPPAGAAP